MNEPNRRVRFQFRLRTLMLLVCLAGPFLAWLVVPAARWLLEPRPPALTQSPASPHCPAGQIPMTTAGCLQCHATPPQRAAPTPKTATPPCHPHWMPGQRTINCAQCHQAAPAAASPSYSRLS